MTSGKLKLIKYNESNVCNFVLSFLFFCSTWGALRF